MGSIQQDAELASLRIALLAPLWTSIPPATYGGTELMVHFLADKLTEWGHKVSLFASGESRTAANLQPVVSECLMAMMDKSAANEYIYYAAHSVSRAISKASEYDVIHCHMGFSWLPFSAASPKPYLTTSGSVLGVDDKAIIDAYPEAWFSVRTNDQATNLSSAGQQRAQTVYNAVDFERSNPKFNQGEYLVFLGRMAPNKNPATAIQIARQLDYPLILAGAPLNNKEKDYFEAEILPYVDGRLIKYVGPVGQAEKLSLLAHASALIFPITWKEPFGIVMIESMACGTPVVATCMGSVPEVIDQGLTGYYSKDASLLPSLVLRALALDRATVYKTAKKRFSIDRMANDYLQIYRQMLGEMSADGCSK